MVGAATGGAAGALMGRQQSLAREAEDVARDVQQVENTPAGVAGAQGMHEAPARPPVTLSARAVAIGVAAGAAAGLAVGIGLSRFGGKRRKPPATGLAAVVELARTLPHQASSVAHHAADDGRALAEDAMAKGRRRFKRTEKAAAKAGRAAVKSANKAGKEAAKTAASATADLRRRAKKKMEKARREADKRTEKARREAGKGIEKARRAAEDGMEQAGQRAARGARRVLAVTGQPEETGRRHGSGLTTLIDLREALDDTISSGESIAYDKPLVTRAI